MICVIILKNQPCGVGLTETFPGFKNKRIRRKGRGRYYDTQNSEMKTSSHEFHLWLSKLLVRVYIKKMLHYRRNSTRNWALKYVSNRNKIFDVFRFICLHETLRTSY